MSKLTFDPKTQSFAIWKREVIERGNACQVSYVEKCSGRAVTGKFHLLSGRGEDKGLHDGKGRNWTGVNDWHGVHDPETVTWREVPRDQTEGEKRVLKEFIETGAHFESYKPELSSTEKSTQKEAFDEQRKIIEVKTPLEKAVKVLAKLSDTRIHHGIEIRGILYKKDSIDGISPDLYVHKKRLIEKEIREKQEAVLDMLKNLNTYESVKKETNNWS